jgi:hypothetical protein
MTKSSDNGDGRWIILMAVQSTNSMVLALISYRLSDFYYIEDKLYCFIIIIVVREIRGREKKKKKRGSGLLEP